jgi:hypothetical protein
MDECHLRRVAAGLIVAVLSTTVVVVPSCADDRPPCGGCIVLLIQPSQSSLLPPRLHGLDVLVQFEGNPDEESSAALARIAERGGRPGLFLTGVTAPSATTLAHALTIVLDQRGVDDPPDALAFDLKTRLTSLRASSGSTTKLGIAMSSAAMSAILARDVGSYVDFVVWDESGSVASNPAPWVYGGSLTDVGRALKATRAASVDRWLWRVPDDEGVARVVMAGASAAASLLPIGLTASADLQMRCGARAAAVFVDPGSLDHVAWAEDCRSEDPIVSEPPAQMVERLQVSERDALIRLRSSRSDRFAEGVAVTAPRRLTVEEIIARHQAAVARQRAHIDTLVSSGTLTVTFEAPGFPAPVTIGAQTVMLSDRTRTEIEQRQIRVNGIAFGSSRVPRLPLIEPERIASPPLAITLGEKYRYRLAGAESVGGRPCYVVAFEPAASGETLFRGRAWIAMDDFGLARVSGAQTTLRGPILSSEQTDEFSRVEDGVWVLSRSDVSQLYQGAGFRTPIHRVLILHDHEINPGDFETRRAAAYRSDSVILRDTPGGYRYLEREKAQETREKGNGKTPEANEEDSGPSAGRRREAAAATRIRTMAFGVIVDPNITRPLPFAGLSYVDFDLFKRGGQLNAFFGGTYGQLAFSIPALANGRWQIAGRAFGIASSYNDRAFAGGRELYERAVRQRPAHGSVWLLAPLGTRISLRAGYDLDYTHFARSDQTAADFEVPAAQVVHGLELALEGQRFGWSGTLWWNPARRTGWRTWGRGSDDYEPGDRDFQRFGASAVRPIVISPRLVARGEIAVMAGHDLDRFSRFAFGTFENRLHGYPSALIRYDRGGVIRGALAWSAARLMRVDGFADLAFVRDDGFGRGLTRFAGFGAALEAPAPFGTLAAVEWGYGPQGINSDGRRGTHVVRVTGYKVF